MQFTCLETKEEIWGLFYQQCQFLGFFFTDFFFFCYQKWYPASLCVGYCICAPVTLPRQWQSWHVSHCGCAHTIFCCAAESHPAPPPLQEQEHQVQWVGSAVCVPLGVKCLEFLHTHNSEWFKKKKKKRRPEHISVYSALLSCNIFLWFYYGRRDTSYIPAAFGRTIPMFTSGKTLKYNLDQNTSFLRQYGYKNMMMIKRKTWQDFHIYMRIVLIRTLEYLERE